MPLLHESPKTRLIQWRRIESFPGYSVSDEGFVRNDENGRSMALLVNQSGVVHVGLTKKRIQYKRSVPLLVANAFLGPPPNKPFDCPINLDGDRFNNSARNLLWRPRWFAVKYVHQFEDAEYDDYCPIEDVATHEHFYNPWNASIKYGLLYTDILLSICNRVPVWPSNQIFQRT